MVIEAGWKSAKNLPEDDLSPLEGRGKRRFYQLSYLLEIKVQVTINDPWLRNIEGLAQEKIGLWTI